MSPPAFANRLGFSSLRLKAFLALLVISSSGCATWLDGGTFGGIDSARAGSFEQRVGAGAAMGTDNQRVYMEVIAGDGYSARDAAQVYSLTNEIGYEGGGAIRASAGVEGTARFVAQAPHPSGFGAGPTAQILFRIHHSTSGFNDLYMGPRASTEVFGEDHRPTTLIASLGLVFRWMFLDTTADREGLPYCFNPTPTHRG